ncbi:carbohydrate ABC transporter permease [Paenibacillus chondroitinus]|uniref:Carbohydrate ABC transporter permease n=1 Tax=Paenibacillus chondroitinus TaxID=59842 RepID=A0ABU6D9L1_9BACL|nr:MULTISPECIES: carbohydrate ABC transporter permease [Paenibacillus]MCY9659834.1 carbohydrate ABC transporter permease [Paenibacillus anseongense]MEB4793987.1 carbohydrate ABC transporter permease [Paenibacillus chondroitinus]
MQINQTVKSPVAKAASAIRTSLSEKVFTLLNYVFFILLGLSTIFPFINLIAKSLSSEAAVVSGMVSLYPIDFQIGTYRYVASNAMFLSAFTISITVTLIGSLLSLFMTTLAAYPLSKPRLRGRKFFILLYLFTMLFSGGLIPTYLLMHTLHLIDKLPVLFLPYMINVYNMLIIKNYFEGLPDSLEESAKIDGASNMTILWRIILPLSLPVLATIGLFYAVTYWNDYFTSLIYINSADMKPLQLYLKELFVSSTDAFLRTNVDASLNVSPQSIQAASIILATLPIVIVYPFLQKYFVKGVLVGSVKG